MCGEMDINTIAAIGLIIGIIIIFGVMILSNKGVVNWPCKKN
jgi:hypothetical protein